MFLKTFVREIDVAVPENGSTYFLVFRRCSSPAAWQMQPARAARNLYTGIFCFVLGRQFIILLGSHVISGIMYG